MAEVEHDDREQQAAKACQRADELFLAGNICGAHRQARKAKRLCPSLPGVANALAAYEVLLAAAGASNNWRAVLGIRPGAAATDAIIKKQFRRLSLLVHPDKNGCTAAEEVFKLLRQALDDALSARPGDRGPCAASHDEDPRHAAHEDRGPAAARDDDEAPRPAAHDEHGAHESPRKKAPLQWQVKLTIYCPSCKDEFPEEKAGTRCASCRELLQSTWQKKPPPKKKPPGAFACSWRCPWCETQHTSDLTVGAWILRCKACSEPAHVDVQGPKMATATCEPLP